MTDRSAITRDAAEALAVAAEAMLTNLWRYCYEYRENADEGPIAEHRLRAAVRRYREASGTEALEREHDCLVSVPTPVGGGSWSEMAIPGVTTWRCACGQEWVWQPGGWGLLADAVHDEGPARPDATGRASAQSLGAAIGALIRLAHEHSGQGDAEPGRLDSAVLAASFAEAVTAVDAAARRLQAAWRNVGGDAGNVGTVAERS